MCVVCLRKTRKYPPKLGRLSRIVSDRPDIITPPAVKTTGGAVNPSNNPYGEPFKIFDA